MCNSKEEAISLTSIPSRMFITTSFPFFGLWGFVDIAFVMTCKPVMLLLLSLDLSVSVWSANRVCHYHTDLCCGCLTLWSFLNFLIETSSEGEYGGHISSTLIQTAPQTSGMVIFPALIWRVALYNNIFFFFFLRAGIKRLSGGSALVAKRSLLQIGFINLLVYGSPDGTLFTHRRRLKWGKALID